MYCQIAESLNSSSWIKLLELSYREGWKHLKIAFTPEHQVFKEAQKYSHGYQYPPMTICQRVSHFLKGMILCLPLVNIVIKVALRILFPTGSQVYKKPLAWKRVNHIVVLMLENRSFDNILGRLYPKSAQFNGLSGNEENSYLDRMGVKHTVKVWNSQGIRMDTPNPDPGEEFDDITCQVFGKHRRLLGAKPTMSGFAQNYYELLCSDKDAQEELRKRRGLLEANVGTIEPTEAEVGDIMHCYGPEQVPVITQLARSFGVSDMYHASAPNQTWPNRFFLHTGTAGGYENNMPVHFPYTMKTIFTRFNELQRDKGWKIYYHDMPQSAVLSDLWPYPNHFECFDEFLKDASRGRLPSYSFIEPRFYIDAEFPNDQHPPHDVRHGEQLIAQVYNALRQSPQWKETLLVITYDEHGGCYDHQPPPAAVPPQLPRKGQKFNFDRYGVRVPAVFVSPLIAPGTILHPPSNSKAPVFDHASIISSIRHCFDLGRPLTHRDRVAPDFSTVLNMPEGLYNMGPEEIIAQPAPQTDIQEAEDLVETDLQKSLNQIAAHLPDHSTLQKGENYLINSVRKINELAHKALNRIEGKFNLAVNSRTGRKETLAHFAKFKAVSTPKGC